MSYILEALKKADADRERNRVPDLHAQPDPLADRERRRSRSRGVWAGMALLVVLGAGLAWWALRPDPAPASSQAPATPMALTPGARPSTTAAAPATRPGVPDAPRPADPPPAPSPAPSAAVIAVQIAPPVTPRPLADPVKAPATSAVVTAPPTAVAPASAAAARVPTLAELPADIRSQLPALNVGGSMYSSSASVRMLILSGQVFREGDSPAPGLTVVQIGPKSSVLAFRGQRFELKH